MNNKEKIANHLADTRIIDTHDHLMQQTERIKMNLNFFDIFIINNYIETDLISAGMKQYELDIIRNSNADLDKKINILLDYWGFIKNTSYSSVLLNTLNDLYDINSLDRSSIHSLNQKININNKPGFYEKILKEKCNIEFVINDLDIIDDIKLKEPDAQYFLPVLRLDNLTCLEGSENINSVEKKYDMDLSSLDCLIELIDSKFNKKNINALKIGSAYKRSLRFEEVDLNEARKSYQNLKKRNAEEADTKDRRLLSDYLHHYIIQKAEELQIPIQIHTGILAGNYTLIDSSDPSLLVNILNKYRSVSFDLLHSGFPFVDKMMVVVKAFPNCYLNLSWIPEISESIYIKSLELAIDLLPLNKISIFGGDHLFIEGTYGALKNTKKVLLNFLSSKTEKDRFNIKEAINFITWTLYENPKRLYVKG